LAVWPFWQCVNISPVATFFAANRSVVPLRLSSCVIVPARPGTIGMMLTTRS
jgi:hypothetical protein